MEDSEEIEVVLADRKEVARIMKDTKRISHCFVQFWVDGVHHRAQ